MKYTGTDWGLKSDRYNFLKHLTIHKCKSNATIYSNKREINIRYSNMIKKKDYLVRKSLLNPLLLY